MKKKDTMTLLYVNENFVAFKICDDPSKINVNDIYKSIYVNFDVKIGDKVFCARCPCCNIIIALFQDEVKLDTFESIVNARGGCSTNVSQYLYDY